MRTNPYLGKTYTLKDCPAYASCEMYGEPVKLNGSYEVMEFCPIEPSAYVNSPCYILIDPNVEEVDLFTLTYTVDEWDLIQQIDPPAYAKLLEYEKTLDNYKEEC